MAAPRESYPLTWPDGRQRIPPSKRKDGKFKLLLGAALDDLVVELTRLRATNMVISSNLKNRLDGIPYSNQAQPDDPGVAVYFTSEGIDYAFCCDTWRRVEDNVRAIGLTIAAIRGIKRWGSGEMMQAAFRGFAALPAPGSDWRTTLGFGQGQVTRDQVRDAYRAKAMKAHPDHGGNQHEMMRLNEALGAAKQEIKW